MTTRLLNNFLLKQNPDLQLVTFPDIDNNIDSFVHPMKKIRTKISGINVNELLIC